MRSTTGARVSDVTASVPVVETRGTRAVAADARGLDKEVSRIPGVGARTAKALTHLRIATVDDLVHHLPRRYLRRGTPTSFADLREGETVTISARVLSADVRPMRQRRGVLMNCRVTDGQRTLELTFFGRHANALGYHQRALLPGTVHFFSGVVGSYRGRLQLTHPEFEPAEDVAEADFLRPVPVYPAAAGVTTWQLSRLIRATLAQLDPAHLDVLPAGYRAEHGLPSGADALAAMHHPADEAEIERARRALAHEEAFVLQTALARRRRSAREEVARPRPEQPGGLREAFDARLPFELTPGQVEVGRVLADDLASPVPMLRLLQGDVGAGKTVVALRAMLQVIDAGGQAVLLAPTEVLAHQHRRSIEDMLGPLAGAGMLGGEENATRVATVTGSLRSRARRQALADIASGAAGIVVGTHALFNEEVVFDDLGLVVVDEQHRFGVDQREVLRARGETTPHLLHMTATPIPRTVAMTVFGDLDITDLPGLPGGRTPVQTVLVDAHNERWTARMWERAAEEVASGGRVFVVVPRIEATSEGEGAFEGAFEGGDDVDGQVDGHAAASGAASVPDDGDPALAGELDLAALAAEQPERDLTDVETLTAQLATLPSLAGIGIGALHGRMGAEEKDEAMRRFVTGKTPVLVSTTVIEVGVDVPEASLMIIMDADRFGLAQLHQLRGRVGRGERAAVCLAVAPGDVGVRSRARLEAFASTTDGFALADTDLALRSEGDVLGAEQSGRRSSLQVLSVARDADVIESARRAARELIAADPELQDHPALAGALTRRVTEDADHFLAAT